MQKSRWIHNCEWWIFLTFDDFEPTMGLNRDTQHNALYDFMIHLSCKRLYVKREVLYISLCDMNCGVSFKIWLYQ